MAKMIPSVCSADTKSGAERVLFNRLKSMKKTENWIVLHSLNIAKHVSQSEGEADFVAIIPFRGVFVLEVKGGGVSYTDGVWHSVDRGKRDHVIKDPGTEAGNAMRSIQEYLRKNGSASVQKTLFGYGVMFPNINAHGVFQSIEIADEQIADIEDCRNSAGLKSFLFRLANYWKDQTANLSKTLPTADDCEEIANLLKPDLENKVLLSSQIRTIENEIVELTETQQIFFDMVSANDRCFVTGNAGTGKTVLAFNHAMQSAAVGLRTGFFCFNRGLAEHLKARIDETTGIISGSFADYMESIVERSGKKPESIPFSELGRYYREVLPELFLEAFAEQNIPPFDVLILDEAQDVLTKEYLTVLDKILSGGIKDGKWAFFLDAERQSIFQKECSTEIIKDRIEEYCENYVVLPLSENCRNSLAIIDKIDAIFNTNTSHRFHKERGAEVKVRSYRKLEDEVDELNDLLNELKSEGVSAEQIVILSPAHFSWSAASKVTAMSVTEDARNREKKALFSTIQSFKGLESEVVVLCDIDAAVMNDREQLVYVGMTRAKGLLCVVAHEEIADRFR